MKSKSVFPLWKKVVVGFAVLFAVITFTVAFRPAVNEVKAAANSITVYSWEDYIDEDLLGEFEDEFGTKVNYYTFATCEEMYNELLKNPKAVDLICPSEYMIMKMRTEGLIKKFTLPETYKENASPYIKEVFESESLKLTEGDETWAIGYMWGTMGILYNSEKVKAEDMQNWEGLWNKTYKNKVTIKDSLRDTYITAIGKVYKDELLALDKEAEDYKAKLTAIFNRTDDETISKVEVALQDLRANLYGFEVDSGKNDILTGKITVNSAWSGDAVFSMDEGDEAGVTLCYSVPEEGSNVWFDGWVMPKDADEEKATDFLNFLSRTENAVRNMDYIGYTSCIAGEDLFYNAVDWYSAESGVLTQEEYDDLDHEEQEEYTYFKIDGEDCYLYPIDFDENEEPIFGFRNEEGTNLITFMSDGEGGMINEEEGDELYSVDLKYFFDPECTDDTYVIYALKSEEGRQLFAQYADEETIYRCAVMDNFDKDTLTKLNAMWNRVKLVTLSTGWIIAIVCVIVLVIAGAIIFKFKDKIFKGGNNDKPKKIKKGYTVVKKERIR